MGGKAEGGLCLCLHHSPHLRRPLAPGNSLYTSLFSFQQGQMPIRRGRNSPVSLTYSYFI